MKKLIMLLGALAPIAGGSALAVSCGDPQSIASKPLEDETLPEGTVGHTMKVEEAVNGEAGKSLWLTQEEFLNLNLGSNNTSISQKVWMNMFDARQRGDEPESTSASLKYFNDHNIYKRIKLNVKKPSVISDEMIENGIVLLTDSIRDTINDQLKLGKWSEHLQKLQNALTEFTTDKEKEGHDVFELLSPLFTAVKEFNLHSDKVKLDEDLKITLDGETAGNFQVEFTKNTIVFFNSGNSTQQFLVGAGKADLKRLIIHVAV